MILQSTSVLPTDDKGLRTLVFTNSMVIVKFTTKDCPVCVRMWRHYLNLSHEDKYKDILFLMMDSKENPVSKKSVKLTGTPFFAIYRNGQLKECLLVADEVVLENLLDRLLDS